MQQLSLAEFDTVANRRTEIGTLVALASARIPVPKFLQEHPDYRGSDVDSLSSAIDYAEKQKRAESFRCLETIALADPELFNEAITQLERHRTRHSAEEIRNLTALWGERHTEHPQGLDIGVNALKRMRGFSELHILCRTAKSLDLIKKSINALVELKDFKFVQSLQIRGRNVSGDLINESHWREYAISDHAAQALQAVIAQRNNDLG